MQKFLKNSILVAAMLLSLFGTRVAFASVGEIEGQLQAAAEEGAGYGEPQDPRVTAAVIIRTALQLIGIVFLVLMLYAGFLWMTAGGNEESVTKAKNIIKASIIGLAIIFAAYSITYFAMYLAIGGDARRIPTSGSQSTNNNLLQ
jgi:Type IV secretion system pilin